MPGTIPFLLKFPANLQVLINGDKVDGMGRHSLRETKNVKKYLSQLGIQSVFESVAKDAGVRQILKDIKRVLEDAHDTSIQDSAAVTPHDVPPSDIPCDKQDNSEDAGSVAEKELISFQEPNQYIQITCRVEHLLNAIGNLELTGPYAEALSQLSYKLEDVAHLVHHLQLYIFIILESGVLNE
ncbi:unnamed protein product [Vicia faba]|uniref:Uncharacterized protein n=1 Tax=Vicia faba TaxID=3906 RepID=A0AAV0YQT0_VICFA|nr:unnamed protein product [Vicia faba]